MTLTPGSGLTDPYPRGNSRGRLDDDTSTTAGASINRCSRSAAASPPASAPLERTVAVVNPTIFFAQSLKDGLIARGIAVTGAAVDLDDVAAELAGTASERRTIVETASPPLREIATVLMKVSQNLYAETLLKAIGAARGGLGHIRRRPDRRAQRPRVVGRARRCVCER